MSSDPYAMAAALKAQAAADRATRLLDEQDPNNLVPRVHQLKQRLSALEARLDAAERESTGPVRWAQ